MAHAESRHVIVAGFATEPRVADLITGSGLALPKRPESLAVCRIQDSGRSTVVLCGGDAVGLMYSALDTPFTVEVSANKATQDPLVEASRTYKVTGIVRNDGTETYDAIGVVATFFDDESFRHGPMKATVPFLLLGPGEECPFSIEIAARRVQAFTLHPNGRQTDRRSTLRKLPSVVSP